MCIIVCHLHDTSCHVKVKCFAVDIDTAAADAADAAVHVW